jgi:DNA-directed RNA polymerase subunit E'/Rpb7
METVNIVRRLCLHPSLLGHGIKGHLLSKARSSYNGECSKDHGYMLEVDKIVRILDNNVTSANSDAMFTVEFQVQVLKPQKGKTYKGAICMVTSSGLFVNVDEKLKVLIPRSELGDYTFQCITVDEGATKENIFSFGDIRLKIGVSVMITITNMQYSGGKFSCYGKLRNSNSHEISIVEEVVANRSGGESESDEEEVNEIDNSDSNGSEEEGEEEAEEEEEEEQEAEEEADEEEADQEEADEEGECDTE